MKSLLISTVILLSAASPSSSEIALRLVVESNVIGRYEPFAGVLVLGNAGTKPASFEAPSYLNKTQRYLVHHSGSTAEIVSLAESTSASDRTVALEPGEQVFIPFYLHRYGGDFLFAETGAYDVVVLVRIGPTGEGEWEEVGAAVSVTVESSAESKEWEAAFEEWGDLVRVFGHSVFEQLEEVQHTRGYTRIMGYQAGGPITWSLAGGCKLPPGMSSSREEILAQYASSAHGEMQKAMWNSIIRQSANCQTGRYEGGDFILLR